MNWLLTRGRVPVLAALAVVVILLAVRAAEVGVERTNESLNASDPIEARHYDDFKRWFGNDEDLLLTVTTTHPLNERALRLLDELTLRISQLPGVVHVLSLTNAVQLVHTDIGATESPLIERPLGAHGEATELEAALARNPDLTGMLISPDRRTTGLIVEIEDRPDDVGYQAAIITALRRLMREKQDRDTQLHLTGVVVQKNDVAALVQRDQKLLMPLALAILALVLFLFFRSLVGLVLPLAVTGASVATTLGVYGLCGLKVNAITALLPPIVMVLSLTVSVHLVQGWSVADIADPATRIRKVVRSLFFPCFFCSLTTVLGFGSLVVSEVPAVRQFGAFAALGAATSFVVGMILIPIALTFASTPAIGRRTTQQRSLQQLLERSTDLVVRRPHAILGVFTLLTVIAVAGLPYVRNNTDLVRFFKSSAPLYRDTLHIDRHLTGTNALEFVVSRRDGAPLTTLDAVTRMARFEQAARGHSQVTAVVSLLAALRQIERAERGDEQFLLPHTQEDLTYAFDLLEVAGDRSLIRRLTSEDFRHFRFSVRTHALGTSVTAPLAEAIVEDGHAVLGEEYDLVPTGAFYRVAADSNRLVVAQVKSFSLALGLVFLSIGVLFRSARLTLVSLIPNAMPLVWTGGLMGLFGVDLSTGTAMIASAVIGLVVDDTIHFLTHFQRLYRGDAVTAVRRTTTGIGSALVSNNLVLVLGFWVGCFGSFKPTIYFSLLSGVTMISALACDLLVTPACLLLFSRPGRQRVKRPLGGQNDGRDTCVVTEGSRARRSHA